MYPQSVDRFLSLNNQNMIHVLKSDSHQKYLNNYNKSYAATWLLSSLVLILLLFFFSVWFPCEGKIMSGQTAILFFFKTFFIDGTLETVWLGIHTALCRAPNLENGPVGNEL